MKLPIIVTPLPDESFKSWVHRLSAPYLVPPVVILRRAMGQEIDPGSMKFSERINCFSSISKISTDDLCVRFQEDIFSSQFLSNANSKPSLWNIELPNKSCATCWEEDYISDRPRYLRRQWLEPWRIFCPEHNVFLQDHVFSHSKDGVFYSSHKKNFVSKVIASNCAALLSEEKWVHKFSYAYEDLYRFDINRLALLSDSIERGDCEFVSIHGCIEGLISGLQLALLNQKPVFSTNLLNWLVGINKYPGHPAFPMLEKGSSKRIIDDLTVANKVLAIECLLPLFLSSKHRESFISLLVGPNSPIRNHVADYKDKIDLNSTMAILSLAIRRDMWASTSSFLKSRQNIYATSLERQYTELEAV